MAHTNEQKRQWRAKMRAAAIEYLGGQCARCGATTKLEFHHKKPTEKHHNVIHYFDLEELNKCELRCVPCHDEFHATKHGTRQRWVVYGCRCGICQAGRIARNEARPSRAKVKKDLLVNRPPKHGTRSKYSVGCRCRRCKNANKQHSQERRKA